MQKAIENELNMKFALQKTKEYYNKHYASNFPGYQPDFSISGGAWLDGRVDKTSDVITISVCLKKNHQCMTSLFFDVDLNTKEVKLNEEKTKEWNR